MNPTACRSTPDLQVRAVWSYLAAWNHKNDDTLLVYSEFVTMPSRLFEFESWLDLFSESGACQVLDFPRTIGENPHESGMFWNVTPDQALSLYESSTKLILKHAEIHALLKALIITNLWLLIPSSSPILMSKKQRVFSPVFSMVLELQMRIWSVLDKRLWVLCITISENVSLLNTHRHIVAILVWRHPRIPMGYK